VTVGKVAQKGLQALGLRLLYKYSKEAIMTKDKKITFALVALILINVVVGIKVFEDPTPKTQPIQNAFVYWG